MDSEKDDDLFGDLAPLEDDLKEEESSKNDKEEVQIGHKTVTEPSSKIPVNAKPKDKLKAILDKRRKKRGKHVDDTKTKSAESTDEPEADDLFDDLEPMNFGGKK